MLWNADELRAVGVDPDNWDAYRDATRKMLTDVTCEIFDEEVAQAFINDAGSFGAAASYFACYGSTLDDIKDVMHGVSNLVDEEMRAELLSTAMSPSWWLYNRLRENVTLHARGRARAKASGYFSRKSRAARREGATAR